MCKYGWWSMLELAPAWHSASTSVHVHSTSASVTIPRRQSRFWHYGCGSDLPTRLKCHSDSLKWIQENYVISIIVLLMILVCVLVWFPEFSLFLGNLLKYEVYAKLIMNGLENMFKLHIVNTHEWKTGPMNEWLMQNKNHVIFSDCFRSLFESLNHLTAREHCRIHTCQYDCNLSRAAMRLWIISSISSDLKLLPWRKILHKIMNRKMGRFEKLSSALLKIITIY